MTPRPYQLVGRDFLAARHGALLADQMRVGKTPQAIMAADKIGAERILVLCPAIATYQWAAQWQEWSDRAPAVILDGPWNVGDSYKGVVISSYNRATMNVAALRAAPRWDVVIADEAHFAKNPTAQRTSVVYGKKGIGWNAEYLWALSGTPAPNHAGELWPVLRAFGIVKATYKEFLRYFTYYSESQGRVFGNKKAHLAELRELIAPITLRRTLAQVAPDMPRLSYNFYVVRQPVGADLGSDIPEEIAEQDRIAVALGKVPALTAEIVANLGARTYEQTVVYGYHLEPLHALAAALKRQGVEVGMLTGDTSPRMRQAVQEGFRLGVVQVVLGQTIAAGTAIDLSAASHGYILELDWTPDNNAQAAHRLVNIEKGTPVTFDILTWPGTWDDAVQRTIIRKVESAVFKS